MQLRQRYVCGIYAGRKCYYNAAPTNTAYYQYLLDPQQRITTPVGAEVKPWDVLPDVGYSIQTEI